MQEVSIYALWSAKQTAKGSPATVGTRRHRQVGGNMSTARADGESGASDLTKHGQTVDWIDQISGTGAPANESTPSELAWTLWAFQGGETITAVTGPPAKTKHTTVPLPGLGFPTTWWARVGYSVIRRHKFNDSFIGSVQIEGSTANKAVRHTPTIISLDPGEIFTADPVPATMPTKIPFLYTDGTGSFTIDGVTFSGHSQFTLVINDDLGPAYGDDVLIFDLTGGDPVVTIAPTMFMDANALAEYNKLVYGTAAPTAGAKPVKTFPGLGAYAFYLKAKTTAGALNGDEFKLTMPNVKWTVPEAPGPNPAGGAAEIALAGAGRQVGATNIWTIDVCNDDATYTT